MTDDVKRIECEEAIRMMLEYLDDELHQHNHDSMDKHLESCKSCYSRMEFEKRLNGMISDVKPKSAPDNLNNRIKKIIKNY